MRRRQRTDQDQIRTSARALRAGQRPRGGGCPSIGAPLLVRDIEMNAARRIARSLWSEARPNIDLYGHQPARPSDPQGAASP